MKASRKWCIGMMMVAMLSGGNLQAAVGVKDLKKEITKTESMPIELKSESAKVSYSIGMDIGNSFKTQSLPIEPALFIQGFQASYAGNKTLITAEQAKDVLMQFQQQVMKERDEKNKMIGAANLKKGQEFLENNKKKEGVVTLPSGLQYQVVKAGSGKSPTLADTVTTHYKGTLVDGTEFDSSYKRNEPATFPVQGVIPGWTEALQRMQPGAQWKLFIPADLAYGERGAGSIIGSHETLIFDLELLSIAPPEEANKG
jgi:FKBP-type peptidyl-prolyl cis-trans isomerase FklB